MRSITSIGALCASLVLASAVGSFALSSPGQPKSIFPNPNTDNSCDANAGLCLTDNTDLTYYAYTNISLDSRSKIDTHMNWIDSTDFSTFKEQNGPVLTGSTETDILYRRDASRMTSVNGIGVSLCDDPVRPLECDQNYVYFKFDDPSHALICHETGHSVGLTHGSDTYPVVNDDTDLLACMQDPESERLGYARWGTHNVGWVNYTYPL